MSEDVQPYPLPRIRSEDFAEFADILAEDDEFPGSYEAWERLAEARQAELADGGDYKPVFVEVKPAGFRRFINEAGASPTMDGLAAYVALLAAYRR